jgi:hypothetical protein
MDLEVDVDKTHDSAPCHTKPVANRVASARILFVEERANVSISVLFEETNNDVLCAISTTVLDENDLVGPARAVEDLEHLLYALLQVAFLVVACEDEAEIRDRRVMAMVAGCVD